MSCPVCAQYSTEQKHYLCLHAEHERESAQSPCHPRRFDSSPVLALSGGLTSRHYGEGHRPSGPAQI